MNKAKPAARIPTMGAISSEEFIYVPRPEDETFSRGIDRHDFLTAIIGPPRMGKTSFIKRHMDELRQDGHRVVYVDLAAQVGQASTPFQWVGKLSSAVGSVLSKDLGSPVDLSEKGLREDGSAYLPLHYMFEGILKASDNTTLVLDEFSNIAALRFHGDLIQALRALQNDSSTYKGLSIYALSYEYLNNYNDIRMMVASALYTRTIYMSNFEVSDKTVAALKNAVPEMPNTALKTVLKRTGGHPHATMKLLELARDQKCTTAKSVATLVDDMIEHPKKLTARQESQLETILPTNPDNEWSHTTADYPPGTKAVLSNLCL